MERLALQIFHITPSNNLAYNPPHHTTHTINHHFKHFKHTYTPKLQSIIMTGTTNTNEKPSVIEKVKAKVENVLHKDKSHTTTTSTTHDTHTTGTTTGNSGLVGEGQAGPHSSRAANAADPRCKLSHVVLEIFKLTSLKLTLISMEAAMLVSHTEPVTQLATPSPDPKAWAEPATLTEPATLARDKLDLTPAELQMLLIPAVRTTSPYHHLLL